jgi:hypothetical protein
MLIKQSLLSVVLILLMLAAPVSSGLLTVAAAAPDTSGSSKSTKSPRATYSQRLSAVIDVMIRQLDLSDYGDLFAGSGFNFKSNYASNRCNIQDRFKLQKEKDQLLNSIITNVRRMDDKAITSQLKKFLILDIEIELLRNLDLIETYAINDERFSRTKLYNKLYEIFKKDLKKFPTVQAADIVDNLIIEYEPVLDHIVHRNGKNIREPGFYSQCGGSYQKIVDDWSRISAKISKGNSKSITDFNIALDKLIKQLSSSRAEFLKNWNKITKEESAFLDKNFKGPTFFKKVANLTKASGAKLTKGFDQVLNAFGAQSAALSKNTSFSKPIDLQQFILEQLKKDPSKQALDTAVANNLSLQEISQSVISTAESAESENQIEIEKAKLKAYFAVQQAHSNLVINSMQRAFNTSKQATAQLKPAGKPTIDTLAKKVDNKQCNASL